MPQQIGSAFGDPGVLQEMVIIEKQEDIRLDTVQCVEQKVNHIEGPDERNLGDQIENLAIDLRAGRVQGLRHIPQELARLVILGVKRNPGDALVFLGQPVSPDGCQAGLAEPGGGLDHGERA